LPPLDSDAALIVVLGYAPPHLAMSAERVSKVLVVDDNRDNLALARSTLEDEGYAVILAEGGVEGVRLFELENPDCVLLDVRMPGMDGFAVCTRIRSAPGGSDVPIVFLTALRDVDTFDEALRVGGDDFLTKPVRPTELLVRVQSALKLRRMGTELREQYDLVRRQRDDLMRLQLQKERLSAFIVHDLKNPVTSMDLNAQVLLADPDLPQRAKDAAKNIRADARSLMRMILNLLDISKAEEGRLAPRRSKLELPATLREVLDAAELKARALEATVEHSFEVPTALADADLLKRVAENLLDNAIRHAPKGGRIVLSSVARPDATEIRVEDNGPGIPEEMRERIFDPFVQLERNVGASRTGRGLGLAFCRLAVEAHGGKIWIEDANPGARFSLVLPNAE
jgi:two-component system sensor histidine kinase/response regulator